MEYCYLANATIQKFVSKRNGLMFLQETFYIKNENKLGDKREDKGTK